MSSTLALVALLSRAYAEDPAAPAGPQPSATTSSSSETSGAPATEASTDAPSAESAPATATEAPTTAETPSAEAQPSAPAEGTAPTAPEAPKDAPQAGTTPSAEPPPPVLTPEQLQKEGQDPPPPPLVTAQLKADPERAEFLTTKMLRMLKPSPYHLPQNPRGQVDFTAYTLEFGEVKLGVANMTVGILPHVQVGTSVPLDVLGIPNVTAKIHATEGGPFDIAAYGNYYVLPRDTVTASYLGIGGITSIRLAEPWSLHLGGGYTKLESEGNLDFATVGSLISGKQIDEGELTADLGVKGEAASVRMATDVRLNRRDSIVLQVESIVWGKSSTTVPDAVVDFLNLDEALSHDGPVPLGEALTASLSWHFAWKHFEARIGVGWSSAPGAWLLQATEFSYRFGGKTRRDEKKMRTTWTNNRKTNKDLKEEHGTEAEPAPPASP